MQMNRRIFVVLFGATIGCIASVARVWWPVEPIAIAMQKQEIIRTVIASPRAVQAKVTKIKHVREIEVFGSSVAPDSLEVRVLDGKEVVHRRMYR